jgi:hypothetical protein
MAAMIPSSEKSINFNGKYYKLWIIRYDNTETTFTVNQSTTSIVVLEPASGGPAVSLGTPANGVKTATLAAGGVATGDGTVTLVTAHGLTIGSSAV